MGEESDPAKEHTPVLYHEVLAALRPRPGSRIIDGTVGAGGHAAGLLAASAPDGVLLGLDRDPAAIGLAAQRLKPFGERVCLKHASYAGMTKEASLMGWTEVDTILLDLGVSSMQLADPARGFSFQKDGPLDMRFDPLQSRKADDLVNGLGEAELAEVLRRYGEEPRASRVARAIVRARPIRGTLALAEVVAAAAGRTRRGIHPATRSFQALRIAVNEELETLAVGLERACQLLRPGGRLAVIAFHSLEDRTVKGFLVRESRDCICPPGQPVCSCDHQARLNVITRRPIKAGAGEVGTNPRARSARLRVAERVGLA